MALIGKLKSDEYYHYILMITHIFTRLIQLIQLKNKEINSGGGTLGRMDKQVRILFTNFK